MLDKINSLVKESIDEAERPADVQKQPEAFFPFEPKSLEEAGLNEIEIEALLLKFLLARGVATGREIAEEICLPFGLVDELLWKFKEAVW